MYRLILHILTRAQLRSCLTPWWHFPTTRKIVNHEDSQFKLGSTVYPVNKVAGMPSIQFWHTKIDSRQILNFSIWSINYNYYQHCLLELLSGNWTWQWTGPKWTESFRLPGLIGGEYLKDFVNGSDSSKHLTKLYSGWFLGSVYSFSEGI